MSQQTFQAVLARLITDPDFRDLVRSRGDSVLGGDLTEVDRWRLVSIASDKGIEITRTLHKGFRLGKITSVLPLTCTLLGSARLAREVSLFWKAYDSTSFYYLQEALAFCDHLSARTRLGLRVMYLEEVVEYERAGLELQQSLLTEEAPKLRAVRFRHDPERLLTRLASGRRPRAIPQRPCVLSGTLDPDRSIKWLITDGE